MKIRVFFISLGLVLMLAGCVKSPYLPVASSPPVDHILLEVSDLYVPIAFYHDLFELGVKSNDGHFAMLEPENMRSFFALGAGIENVPAFEGRRRDGNGELCANSGIENHSRAATLHLGHGSVFLPTLTDTFGRSSIEVMRPIAWQIFQEDSMQVVR